MDLTEHFYSQFSPLFKVFYRRLGWNHQKFLQFLLTSEHLFANNWATAKLYDEKYPQLNIGDCMEQEE